MGSQGLVQSIHATGPDRPITYMSWSDAARFANWVSNGQPSGPAGLATTENGVYSGPVAGWAAEKGFQCEFPGRGAGRRQ